MQLGTRWNVGAAAPARLAQPMLDAITSVESELAAIDAAGGQWTKWRWTLTWLEGMPVVELDDGTTIRESQGGTVTITQPD